jgi:hypothetical protein
MGSLVHTIEVAFFSLVKFHENANLKIDVIFEGFQLQEVRGRKNCQISIEKSVSPKM